MGIIPVNKKYLFTCILLALMLCISQVMGYMMPIMICLGLFMILAAWCCGFNFTLPFLLFFLPWSPILRASPDSYSFYTFAMVLICLISIVKRNFNFRNYQLITGILILFLTLLSKVLDGGSLSFNYIAFIMMLVLFPSVKEEWREGKYDFYQIVTFFAVGVIIAAMCALNFADSPSIRKFIRVDTYLTIIRRSGFYGDANFYTAQILAAMGGVLSLFLQEEKRGRLVFLGILLGFLLYCGFLSASKSFVLVACGLILIWVVGIMQMRDRTGLKLTLIISLLIAITYIATSSLFSGLLQVMLTRFSFSKDLNSFTTGRTALWQVYLQEILQNSKVFFLGKGFTDVKVGRLGSHNTIIQVFYQFGLVGMPALFYWIRCFFGERDRTQNGENPGAMKKLLVFSGAFVPWLAIDALFFDEFFLLQWYMLMAIYYLQPDNNTAKKIESGSDGGNIWMRK